MTATEIEDLYRRHAAELHAYLYRRAGQAGADLLADVFVVAMQRRDDMPEPALRRAWTYGIARRLLLANSRQTRRRQSAERDLTGFALSAGFPRQEGPTARDQAVRQALASLREEDRELIRLTEWEQMTITDAAVIVGLKPGTARVRLHRARRALANHSALRGLLDVDEDRGQAQAAPR